MDRFLFFLRCLMFLVALSAASNCVTISVSQTSGVDEKLCLENNATQPCKSIGFVVENMLNSDFASVEILILDKVYKWSRDMVKIHTTKVISLSFIGGNKDVFIQCSTSRESGIFDIFGPAMSVEFRHLGFQNCGSETLPMPVILVNNTLNISFLSCQFQNNSNGAVFLINSSIYIEHCVFTSNSFFIQNTSCCLPRLCDVLPTIGGALGVLFQNDRKDRTIGIYHTLFNNNSVSTNNNTHFVGRKKSKLVPNRGGAVQITSTGLSSGRLKFKTFNCSFNNNQATLGGALHIEYTDMASNNIMDIVQTNFTNNTGTQVGGSFMVTLWDHSTATNLTMIDVRIENSWSRSGSGVYIFLRSEKIVHDTPLKQEFLFKRVQLYNNYGPMGSAVKIVSPIFGRRAIGIIPVFEDCVFANNINPQSSKYGDLPSFIVDRVDLQFKGTNVFLQNRFFGAALFSSSVIQVHGNLSFIGNVGKNGGALLVKDSQIVVYPSSQLLFMNNFAQLSGGAIFVETKTIYKVAVENNPECFLTYYQQNIAPEKWQASFVFINNTATLKGGAVNIDSLIQCAWDAQTQMLDFKKSLKWERTFVYMNNTVESFQNPTQKMCNCDISTNVDKLIEKSNLGNSSIKISPGEIQTLDIGAYDELNNSIFTFISDIALNQINGNFSTWLQLLHDFFIIQPDKPNQVQIQYKLLNDDIHSLPNQTEVCFRDVWTNQASLPFTIEPKACNPGYILHRGICVCDTKRTGILGCTADGHYLQFQAGYWIGNINNELTIEPCPFGYCSCPKHFIKGNELFSSQGCFFNSVHYNDTSVCAHNRKGYLCGDCQHGYTVSTQSYKCVKEDDKAVCRWNLGVSILFTIALCIAIIYFNPGLDNELRGPLFFFQVLSLFFRPITLDRINDDSFYKLVYYLSSIFDFTIPVTSFLNSDCYLFDGLTNETMIIFGYTSSFFALLVMMVTMVLNKLGVIRIVRKNAVQCFWLLLILMYTSLTKTSLEILCCAKIAGKYRLFAQASVICFTKSTHIVMAVVAIVILTTCCIVIPLGIFLLTSTKVFRASPHYIDTLTYRLKPAFAWWWIVEFWRRLLLVIVAVFVPIWNHTQVSLIITSLVILTIQCYCQPYQERRANISETVFLFLLCFISVLQMLEVSNDDKVKIYMTIVCLLLAYTIFVILWKLSHHLKRRPFFQKRFATYGAVNDNNESVTFVTAAEKKEEEEN